MGKICPVGTGPAGSVFGEDSLYGETRDTKLGGRHVAKRSSDPRVAYPEDTGQVQDLLRVFGITDPLPHGVVSIWREFVLSRPRV